MSERTPFLGRTGGDDDYDLDDHVIKTTPANFHFKNSLWISAIVTSALSLATFGLLLAAYIFITKNNDFTQTWRSEETIRDLTIVLFVTALVTLPSIFLQIPILLNMAAHIAMSIVLFVFSSRLFGDGWPDSNFCYRWSRTPNGGYRNRLPETWGCKEARTTARILLGVGAGVSIALGLLLLVMLLLRTVAVFRTKKSWQSKYFKEWRNLSWKPSGFTIQFTLSVIKQEPGGNNEAGKGKSPPAQTTASEEEGRLIET